VGGCCREEGPVKAPLGKGVGGGRGAKGLVHRGCA